MDIENVQGSCLLSSLSNVSVKIDQDERDDLGFFKNPVHQNQILYSNLRQQSIDVILENQNFAQDTLFDKILWKSNTQANSNPEESNIFYLEAEQCGVSEQIMIPPKNQKSKISLKKKRKTRKTKFLIKKRKPSNKKRQNAEARRKRLQIQLRLRNQTKNIPKNYGKAIISFMINNFQKLKHIYEFREVDQEDLIKELKQRKKSINTIADLRGLWIDHKHAKCMRILSNIFLRKYSSGYIFNSKISNTGAHIKYKCKLLKAIKEPGKFECIKNF